MMEVPQVDITRMNFSQLSELKDRIESGCARCGRWERLGCASGLRPRPL
jgi:hypothetical protein